MFGSPMACPTSCPSHRQSLGCPSSSVMTLPAKAGSFSGDGTTLLRRVAVHRYRLKAPSEPLRCQERERAFQDVQSSSQVPADTQAAGSAAMPTITECLRNMCAAARAIPRCAGWIHLDDCPTGALCLFAQDRDELTPTRVVNGLCQHRAGEPSEVQVFDRDQSVFLYYCVRRLVVEVPPLVGDVQMHSRDFLTRLQPTMAALRRATLRWAIRKRRWAARK
jgi:hypothetical protein